MVLYLISALRPFSNWTPSLTLLSRKHLNFCDGDQAGSLGHVDVASKRPLVTADCAIVVPAEEVGHSVKTVKGEVIRSAA